MERDFPIGHPAASDYKHEPYRPASDDLVLDFPPKHPAHKGKNCSALDTPDGMRDNQAKAVQSLTDLAAQGSLPPLRVPGRDEPLPLSPAQLAHLYAARKAYDPKVGPTPDCEQAVGYIVALGYSRAEAIILFINYAQPPEPDGSAGT